MTSPDDPHAPVVRRACAGDVRAIETLVEAVQNGIYALAVRMLWHPDDAQDATQEILVKVVTHLSSFRGESRFTSWCYAIAANYLRTVRRSRVETAGYTFESFEEELHETAVVDQETASSPEYAVAIEEVKIGCTLGMLQCLDREHRLAYILGEIMELDQNEAVYITGSTRAAFRQRLARARRAIVAFTSRVCGVVNERNTCHCENHVTYALRTGRVRLGSPTFGAGVRVSAQSFGEIQREVRRLEELRRAAALYRAHPAFLAPEGLKKALRDLLLSAAQPPPA